MGNLPSCPDITLPDGIWMNCSIPEELEQFDLSVADPVKPTGEINHVTPRQLTPQQINFILDGLDLRVVAKIEEGSEPEVPDDIPIAPNLDVEIGAPDSVEPPEFPRGNVDPNQLDDLIIESLSHSFYAILNSMRVPALSFVTLSQPERPNGEVAPLLSSFLEGNIQLRNLKNALEGMASIWDNHPIYRALKEALANQITSDQGIFDGFDPEILEEIVESIFRFQAKEPLEDLGTSFGSGQFYESLRQRMINAFKRDVALIMRDIAKTEKISLLEMAEALNQERAVANKQYNDARLDEALSRIQLSLMRMSEAVLLYNFEVSQTLISHFEYKFKMAEALQKAQHYFKQIDFANLVDKGNKKAITLFEKQINLVRQIFQAYEQEMELSKDMIELQSLAVEVENANLRNDLTVQEGLLEQANNEVFYLETLLLSESNKVDAEIEREILQAKIEQTEILVRKIKRSLDTKNDLVQTGNIENEDIKLGLEARLKATEKALQRELARIDAVRELQDLRLQERAETANEQVDSDLRKEGENFDYRLATIKWRLWEPENYRKAIEQMRLDAHNGYMNAISQAADWRRSAAVRQQLIHILASA